MREIKYLDLWEYTIDYEGRDCDGGHYDRKQFLAVEWPEEVVFDKADLFGEGGVSSVRLVDGSDREHGTANVGTGTEEGYRAYEITWTRVTSTQVLRQFLEDYEKDGPRLSYEHRYTSLYKARFGHTIAEKFPEAVTVKFRPSAHRGELWQLLEVRGFDERHCPVAFWDGGESPFDQDTLKQLSSDLEGLYSGLKEGDTEPVSVHV